MTATSLPLVVYGTTVIVGRLTVARFVDRLPPLRLGAVALVTMAAGLGIDATAGSATTLIAGVVVLGVGVTFSTPAFFAAIFATARPSERGAASAMASTALDLGLGGGPILLGYVAAAAGIPRAFGVGAVVALAGAGWTITRRPAAS
jgi:predicted MFS family arabinose efflux permease